MKYVEINPDEVPTSFLLEADPSTKSIKSYLLGSWCFAAKTNNEIVGVCVVKSIAENGAGYLDPISALNRSVLNFSFLWLFTSSSSKQMIMMA